jgi:hypothetical protein
MGNGRLNFINALHRRHAINYYLIILLVTRNTQNNFPTFYFMQQVLYKS